MSFKIQKLEAWDLAKFAKDFQKQWSENSLFAVKIFDSFFERSVHQRVLKQGAFSILNGKELKADWLTENALNYDLFGMNNDEQFYAVMNAESLSKETQQFFINFHQQLTKKFIFYFQGKAKFLDELLKQEVSQAVSFEAPKFWDYSKFFLLLLAEAGLEHESSLSRVSFEGKDMELGDIAQFVQKLQQEYAGESLKLNQIQKLLDEKAEDRFLIATFLMEKKFKPFYEALTKVAHDQDRLRSVVMFLQTHFLKVKYPSYLKSDKRPSRYDKAIQQAHSQWKAIEIEKVMNLLSDLEMMSKVSPDQIVEFLKTKKGELTFASHIR